MTILWEAFGRNSLSKVPPTGTVQAISTRQRSLQRDDICTARTHAGRQCRCRKARGSEFCNFHDPEISARIREQARLKREARKKQMAALPAGYLKSLNSPDGVPSALDNLFREVRLGVVSPRTANVMLSIIDRLLIHDKLVATHGKRRVSKQLRSQEVRRQLVEVLEEMQLPTPARPVKATVSSVPPATKLITQT